MHSSVCKHIHAVALWQVNQKSSSQSENDDDGTMPSSSASNQPLLDPENNDDLAIPSSSTSGQLLQDPQSLLKRIESSETLEVPDCNEMGSIQSKLAAVVQAFQVKDSIDSASAKLAHNYLDGLLRLAKQSTDKGLRPAPSPANKRLEKQPRGWVPKKRASRGGPATALQRHYILKQATEGGEVPVILTETAHNYSA